MITIEHVYAFNTGRQYSDKGQRISAMRLPDGRVAFVDLDRGIDGITQISIEERDQIREKIPAYDQYLYNLRTTPGFVLACYDYGLIHYSVDFDSKRTYSWEELNPVKQALIEAAKKL